MSHSRRTCLLLLLFPFALIFLCNAATSLRAGWQHYNSMAAAVLIAKQLGYTPQTHLIQAPQCYDSWVDGETCAAMIMFTSLFDKENFHQQMQAVNQGEDLYFGVRQFATDFRDLFYLFPPWYGRVLTIDGHTPDDDHPFAHFPASEWRWQHSALTGTSVELYEISSLDALVQLDGTTIRNNIVVVKTSMGRISIFAQLYYLFTGWGKNKQHAPIADTMRALVSSADMAMVALIDNNIARPNEALRLDAAVGSAGKLVPALIVTGTLLAPDGVTQTLHFRDDGKQGDIEIADGVYATQFNAPAAAGRTTILLQATSGVIVAETQMEIYTVPVPQAAAVQQVVRERPVDENGDGIFDVLAFDLRVPISAAGDYKFTGWLARESGQYAGITRLPLHANSIADPALQVKNDAPIPTVEMATLRFSDLAIRYLEVSGPYTLTNIKILGRVTIDTAAGVSLPKPRTYLWEDDFPVNYQTAAYDPSQFRDESAKTVIDRIPAQVIDSVDWAEDRNDDGLYDRLTISVTVATLTPGRYSWTGELVDQAGQSVSWMNGKGELADKVAVPFIFPGWAIRKAGLTAPFRLNIMNLSRIGGSSNALQSLTKVHTTQPYRLAQFSPNFFLETREEVIDVNHDGLYERLVIRLVPDLPFAGRYEYRSRFIDRNGVEIQQRKQISALGGESPIVLELDGVQLRVGQHDGPYVLSDLQIMEERNDNLYYHYADAYTSTDYLAEQFTRN